MNFDVFGPFEISRHGSRKMILDQSYRDLIERLRSEDPQLEFACGCYVFGIRAGGGYTPYYVGQACRRTIIKEGFSPRNREKYNIVISMTNGVPVIFMIPMLTTGGRLRKCRKAPGGILSIDFLERWLIAKCLEKNPDLINNRETKFLRKLHVKGIFNPRRGEATSSSQELRRAIE